MVDRQSGFSTEPVRRISRRSLLALPPAAVAGMTIAAPAHADVEPTASPPPGAAAAVTNGAGGRDVFARTASGNLAHWTHGPAGWSAGTNLGGDLAIGSSPAAFTNGSGDLHVFARATNNNILHYSFTVQSGWRMENIGSTITTAPAVITNGRGTAHIFARGTNGALYDVYLSGGVWKYVNLGGQVAPGVAATAFTNGPGTAHVFVRGTDSQLHQFWYTPSGWTRALVSGAFTNTPTAISRGAGDAHVFVRGGNAGLYDVYYSGGWNYVNLGGNIY